MSQNTSSAVMAQRSEPADSLDDFPTPPWGGRALAEHVLGRVALAGKTVWEPAVNRGYLKRGLDNYAGRVFGSDIHDYGAGFPVFDFTRPGLFAGPLPSFLPSPPDWIITNPPFKAAAEFIEQGLAVARVGVAMLLRTQILEGGSRFDKLYRPMANRWTFSQFVERIPMVRGRVDPAVSSATAYGWLTFWKEPQDPAFLLARRHIPPCRKALERPGDYA